MTEPTNAELAKMLRARQQKLKEAGGDYMTLGAGEPLLDLAASRLESAATWEDAAKVAEREALAAEIERRGVKFADVPPGQFECLSGHETLLVLAALRAKGK